MDTNWNARHVQPRIAAFREWLARAGAEVLLPTNQWEAVRFRDGAITSIIYTNAKGGATFTGSALAAWEAYRNQQAWRASDTPDKVKRVTGKRRGRFVLAIRERDGHDCFFCAREVDEEHESVEHLVNVADGGPNHVSNMFLAHTLCNLEAGNISAVEKIKMFHAARVKHLIQRSDSANRNRRATDQRANKPLPWEDDDEQELQTQAGA